jgi:hypothetical protein
VIVVLALLLSACSSQAASPPTVTDLTAHHYVSTPRSYLGSNLDGYATYRTPVGGRSEVRLEFTFIQRAVRIEFVSKDNWFDHHAGARLYLPGDKPECQPDPIQKVIECQFGFAGGSTGIYLYGTAVDAGTFHYAVRLREQIAGTTQWTGPANGRDLVVEWDETVTA